MLVVAFRPKLFGVEPDKNGRSEFHSHPRSLHELHWQQYLRFRRLLPPQVPKHHLHDRHRVIRGACAKLRYNFYL